MSNKLNELLGSIMGELKQISNTETIIGKPVKFGDKSVVPVSKVSVGFGVGGGEDESKGGAKFGGGGGGGARVEPVGFIIIDGDRVSFLPTSHDKYQGLIEAIPDLVNKLRGFKKDKSDKEPEKNSDDIK